ncbi:MAG: IPT/TIG domain-containing protein [Deltaproteobacteria bacterium]|nr:MAG: IPT/TIG domain-containing protein [Deltaproteobacteria bacterium]
MRYSSIKCKSFIPLSLLTIFFYLGSAKPAQALEEGYCFNSSTVVVTGSITDSSGISEIIVTVDGATPSDFNIDNGNWTATFTGLVDGPHTLVVIGTDACGSGNTATTDPLGFIVDATPLVITSINPTTGPDEGGTEVVIEGSGFAGVGPVSSVTFDGVMVTGFTVESDTQITVTTPAGTIGPVDVVISDDCGNTDTCPNCFEYVLPVYYAVIVGDPSDVSISSITVAPNSTFSVMVYGSVLIGGELSPDLGSGPESMGDYDFRLRHEIAYLTINGITKTGTPFPDPGCEFDSPMVTWSNTNDGDGYATSSFNDTNNGATTLVGPTGADIPLGVVNFSAGAAIGPTTIYISDVIDYNSNNLIALDDTPRRALRVNIIPQYYAVIAGVPSGPATDTIVVPPSSDFSVMVYGSVLIGGELSPDLGSGPESMSAYDFRFRHEVAYLTINGITKTGILFPDPGYEFTDPLSILSNTDEGDGYATSSFNDVNGASITTPTGADIPLAVVNFSAGAASGPTTIYISEVIDYNSNTFVPLDTTPRRPLWVKVTDDSTPPNIQISYPANGDTVNAYRLVVSGTVSEPESWIESVTVDGLAADISALPDWTATLTDLPAGPLTIVAEAVNGALLSDQDTVTVNVRPIAAVRLMSGGESVVTVGLSANPTFTIDVLGSVLIDGVLSPDLGLGAESLGVYDFRVRHEVAKLNLADMKGSGIDRSLCPIPGCEFDEVPIFTIRNSDEGDGYATSDFNRFNNMQTSGQGPVGADIPLSRLIFSPVETGTTIVYISGVVSYESNNFESLDKLPREEITVIITP